MNLPKKEFLTLPKLNEKVRIKDNKIFKMCNTKYVSPESFLTYLVSLPNISGAILPDDILIDDSIYGVTSKYLNGSQNITEYLDNPRFEIDIINTIKKIFITLNKIHEFFIIGDVRNENILLTPDEPYFIDFENGRRFDENRFLQTYYSIYVKKLAIDDSKISDTFKTLISVLSIYYTLDLEYLFMGKSMEDLLLLLINSKSNKYLIYYLESLINDVKNGNYESFFDFTKIIDYLTPPSEKEKNRLIRTLIS